MPGYYPSCENVILPHNCNPCAAREYGRVRSVALIRSDYVDTILADVDNPTVWSAGQNDDLKVIVIPQTHGEYPAPSEITGPGYGDQVEQIVGFDHQVTFFDPNYADNCDFWNAMRSARNYHLAYRTSSKIHITQDPVTWIPKAPIADDLGSEVVWNVLAKWRNINTPCAYDVPANIFDTCYEPE